ncbi:MAG: ribulose-phosphate 3-epimerase [Bacteroidetes bacterium 4572_77]|nr:MAG: ribulose-phosphate 3-epimerase [Bacteroidetes bacterium 4572_77]
MNVKQKKISPSLLSADFVNLERDVKMLEEGGAHLLHIDVMDGHFVPNITIGPPVVKAINKIATIPLDVHLMIENPGLYVEDFIKAGADYISIHVESTPHVHRVIQTIKAAGIKAGVSLNPHTSLSTIENILGDIDMVLIMSVNPGFGGQSFIPQALDKVRKLKLMLKEHNAEHVEIEIDGGIKLDNIKEVAEAGVDIFVSGSGIFGAKDPKAMIQQMIEVIG